MSPILSISKNEFLVNFSVNVNEFVNFIRYCVAPCHNGHFDVHIGGAGSTVSEFTAAARFYRLKFIYIEI